MNITSETKQDCKNLKNTTTKNKLDNCILNEHENFPKKIYSPKHEISSSKQNITEKFNQIEIKNRHHLKNKQIQTKYINLNEITNHGSSTNKISKLGTLDCSSSNFKNISNFNESCMPERISETSRFDNISEENTIEVNGNQQVSNIDKNKNIFTFNDLKNELVNNTKNKNKLKINSNIITNNINENVLNKNNFLFERNSIHLNNTKKIEEEKNYQIKKYRFLINYKYTLNPIKRCENAQKIQKWWSKYIHPKILKKLKIIKIQNVFRGYIMRKNLNDIICVSILYQNFINKLRHAISNYVRRNYF